MREEDLIEIAEWLPSRARKQVKPLIRVMETMRRARAELALYVGDSADEAVIQLSMGIRAVDRVLEAMKVQATSGYWKEQEEEMRKKASVNRRAWAKILRTETAAEDIQVVAADDFLSGLMASEGAEVEE